MKVSMVVPLLLLLFLSFYPTVQAFSIKTTPTTTKVISCCATTRMSHGQKNRYYQAFYQPDTIISRKSSNNDNNEEKVDQLQRLGFTEQEIKQRNSINNDVGNNSKTTEQQQMNVRVNILPNVDPLTLTAIGFSLIALNFFVFANMGDGGIAGVVASIINLSRQ